MVAKPLLVGGQLVALVLLQLQVKWRRRKHALLDVLSPAVVFLVLVYGVLLAPSVPVPPFRYGGPPVVADAVPAPPLPDGVVGPLLALHLYSSVHSPRFRFETQFLPQLVAPSNATPLGLSPLAVDILGHLFGNANATAPFAVPSFDEFNAVRALARVVLGLLGGKRVAHVTPEAWLLLHSGKLAILNTSAPKSVTNLSAGGGGLALEALQYFRGTSAAFAASAYGEVFPSLDAAAQRAADDGDTLWAAIEFVPAAADPRYYGDGDDDSDADRTALNLDDGRLGRYAVKLHMNETALPDTSKASDAFPRGLGSAYRQYLYSGFATLQAELGEFLLRRTSAAHGVARPLRFGLLPRALSACGAATGQATWFARPDLITQYLLSMLPPITTVTLTPLDAAATDHPCLVEMQLNCSGAASSAGGVAGCLLGPNRSRWGLPCQLALDAFTITCAPSLAACGAPSRAGDQLSLL